MNRMLPLMALAAAAVLGGMAFSVTSATAQTPATKCGPVSYSNAQQQYVGVPCTPEAPKQEAGQAAPCGPVSYSNAQQKYVGVPCTAPTPQAEAGQASPCGPVAYSNAQQAYVGVPCSHK